MNRESFSYKAFFFTDIHNCALKKFTNLNLGVAKLQIER